MRRMTMVACLLVVCEALAQTLPPFPTPTVDGVLPEEALSPFASVEANLPYFDDFSWREFIALTWPAEISKAPPYTRGVRDKAKAYGNASGTLVWQTWKSDYEIFLPGGAPPKPWDSYDTPSPCGGKLTAYQTILASFDKYHGFNQAGFGVDAGPLISRNAKYVRYETRVNRPEYDYILNPLPRQPGPLYLAVNLPSKTNGIPLLEFPKGAMELKAGWRDLTNVPQSQKERYFTTTALLLDPVSGVCKPATLGLVALHIIHKTKSFPNWVWSTFEQIDNVPAITGEAEYGRPPYGFNDNDPNNQKLSPMGKPITRCNPPVPEPQPTQAVRIRAISPSTQKTNGLYHGTPQLQNTIWQNYQLTLTQWPIAGGLSTFPSTAQPKPQINTANVAAETWFQNSTATSCMACHKKATDSSKPDVENKPDWDYVWFLPLGAYNPDAPVPQCQEVNAFTLANRTLAVARRETVRAETAARTAHEAAIAALKRIMAAQAPIARAKRK